MSINVVVADDHEVVRRGLEGLFRNSNIKIVGEAEDGEQAIKQTLKQKPDVLLMDIRMPGTDGIAALESVRKKSPNTRVVMLSTYDNPTYVARSVALGATDFVLKGADRKSLIGAIERAAAGDSPAEESVLEQVKDAMERRNERSEDDIPLTNRELQVLRHIALGLSNREIGKSLGISVETVKEHVQNILRKLQVTDRTQAAVWAVRKELV